MNKRMIKLGMALLLLVSAILACEASASTANIQEAKMSRDVEGTQLTTAFSPDDIFYCLVDLANAPDDTTIKAVWTAVQVEGAEQNTLIDETEITSGSGSIHFDLSNTNPWPMGTYKVELYLNGELVQTLEFQVQ